MSKQSLLPAQKADWPFGPSEAAQLIRATAWSHTSLDAPETWCTTLRTTVDLLLVCKFPMVLLWGPDLVQIYNDGYRIIMGSKHPAGMGQPTQACWPEVWEFNEPIYSQVWNGDSLTLEDQLSRSHVTASDRSRRNVLTLLPAGGRI